MALPYPDPGMVTITGDPNNPFGGQITSQNMNTADPNETPEQAIMRLHQGGLAVDQIAQLTGFPPDQVAMQVATMTDSNTFKAGPGHALHLPTGQFRSGDELYSDFTDQSPDQVAMQDAIRAGDHGSFMPGGQFSQASTDGGIESLLSAPTDAAAPDFVDEGTTAADIAANVRGGPADPKDYLTELRLHEAITNLGVDRTDAENQALDDDPNNLGLKVSDANLVGAIARGAEDEDAKATLRTAGEIDQEFDLDNPDDLKSRLEVYKRAAEIFYDTDDLKELIPQPDKSLPFMIAGAALIQAGNEGDTWGEALSSAFLQYTMSSKKEEQDYEKQILGLEIGKKKAAQELATQMFLGDREQQQAFANSMLKANAKFYKVEGQNLPVPFTDAELLAIRNMGPGPGVPVILDEWNAERHGVLKNFTVTDDAGNMMVQGLTDTEALKQRDSGLWENVTVGDRTGDLKLYNINGVNKMILPEDAQRLQRDGKEVFAATPNNTMKALDTTTNRNVFVSRSAVDADRAAGTGRYVPVEEMIGYATDINGNPMIGPASQVFGAVGVSGAQREIQRFQELYTNANFNRNRVLTTIDEIRSAVGAARNESGTLLWGTGGQAGLVGRRIINEVNQLSKVFSDPTKQWNFYISNKEDGLYDPQTDRTLSYDSFQKKYGDRFSESNLGKFLLDTGLRRVEVNNLIFQLALTSAMLEGQKGRDISDKDIERFLTRAGANATSEDELLVLLDNLEFNAIDYVDKLADNQVRLSPTMMPNPDGDGSVRALEYRFRGIIDADNDYVPTQGKEAIGERRRRLDTRRQLPGTVGSVPPSVAVDGPTLEPRPLDDKLSGDGNRTFLQTYQYLKSLEKPDRDEHIQWLSDSLSNEQFNALDKYIYGRGGL